ncbi:MAG TPA: DNA-binding protein [Chloroflexi bacterium]|nr:DNA-binding protein [Chloroflexota bacterium]HAL26365.1 DNA-binding protein [Chloroflexota bacterium]
MNRLTVDQAARRLKRNPNLVRRWLRDGRLRGENIGNGKGGVWVITERELERFARNEPERRKRRT